MTIQEAMVMMTVVVVIVMAAAGTIGEAEVVVENVLTSEVGEAASEAAKVA